eukprot:m.169373 g.169373  ORF g.169373 m.169373 type:complete len:273 (+) comp16668_c0_seq16:328-1146(+)
MNASPSSTTAASRCCRLCNRSFKRLDHFRAHLLTHSTKHQKPYGCQECGKKYSHITTLRRHLAQKGHKGVVEDVELLKELLGPALMRDGRTVRGSSVRVNQCSVSRTARNSASCQSATAFPTTTEFVPQSPSTCHSNSGAAVVDASARQDAADPTEVGLQKSWLVAPTIQSFPGAPTLTAAAQVPVPSPWQQLNEVAASSGTVPGPMPEGFNPSLLSGMAMSMPSAMMFSPQMSAMAPWSMMAQSVLQAQMLAASQQAAYYNVVGGMLNETT